MRKVLLNLTVLLVSSFAFAGGTIIENGGGTTTADVQSLQKALAGNKPLRAEEIPGLNYLTQKLWQVPISSQTSLNVVASLQPMPDHIYYKVDAAFLRGPAQKIFTQYSQELNLAESEIQILHIGGFDMRNSITLLLPSFFNQTSEKNAAVELAAYLWKSRNESQGTITEYKNTFLQYMDHPEDREASYKVFSGLIYQDDWDSILGVTWQFDRTYTPAIFSDPEKRSLRFKDFFGKDYALCVLDLRDDCDELLQALRQNNSLFVRSFANFVLDEETPEKQGQHHVKWQGIEFNDEFKTLSAKARADLLESIYFRIDEEGLPLRARVFANSREVGHFVLEKTRGY